ncbi:MULTISPECIES: FHA domain-containing protein [unclassified Variovorax]|uniref:FHA domain-containing protein n=1 Tax=unclassified Variovorax TaxID=663243 RepID=UPI001BD46394|nr:MULTISPECIES: FHA domain-containing protein [unclassified Variovorax]
MILTIEGQPFRTVRLLEGETLVGRDPECNLVLERAAVSKHHAVIVCRGDGAALLRDLESRNGTLVNGKATSVTPLTSGDIIKIADVEMEYVPRVLPDAEELPQPPREEDTAAGATTGPGELHPLVRTQPRIGGPGGATWAGDAVAFTIAARGRDIQAFISADALLVHFDVLVYGPDGPTRAVEAYEENYVAINVVAWKIFDETGREPIRIRNSDFEA